MHLNDVFHDALTMLAVCFKLIQRTSKNHLLTKSGLSETKRPVCNFVIFSTFLKLAQFFLHGRIMGITNPTGKNHRRRKFAISGHRGISMKGAPGQGPKVMQLQR